MTFREVQVQAVLDVQWGDTKTTKSSYVDDGYLAYSATGPDGFLSNYDYDCDGVVLSAIGANCGSTFFATNKWSCIKNTIRILPRSSEIDLKYFYFMTKSPNFWPLRGSAQPFISQTDIREMVIKIPDLATQKKIGEIIYGLELSIETKKQISKTLEEIAQEIFKSWFMDFDPVKAKMASEKPVGMDDATAELFPDSMEDSELGSIPKGWHAVPLTDFFEVLSGGTPKTTEESYWGGEIPWFSVVDAPNSEGCFFVKTEKTITELGVSKSAAKVVRPGVTVISARGTVGKTAIVAVPSTFNQSCYGLMGKHGDFYTYLLVKNQIAQLRNISHGGMFDTITRDTFSAIKSSNPGEKVIGAFERLVEPMFMQIRNLQFESELIFQICDALLPRLISGELQIPEEMLVS